MKQEDWQKEYQRRREAQQRALRERTALVETAWAEFPIWRKRLQEARMAYSLASLRKENKEQARILCEQVEEEGQQALLDHGFAADALELHYDCPVCRDYGLLGEKPCECLQTYLKKQRVQDGVWRDCLWQNFDQFSLDFFPEDDGQRERMRKARDICETYANQPLESNPGSLMLIGNAGQGKTFLLNCIGERLLSQRRNVEKTTGYRFHQMLLNQLIGEKNEAPYRRLASAEFLLFDDLGSEPRTGKDITEHYFFALLDERRAARLPMVITSNLSDADLHARYGERGLSRLFDRENVKVFRLRGKDMRLHGKRV